MRIELQIERHQLRLLLPQPGGIVLLDQRRDPLVHLIEQPDHPAELIPSAFRYARVKPPRSTVRIACLIRTSGFVTRNDIR